MAKWNSTKHGMSGTSEHNTWKQMTQRCTNPRHAAFPRYGGRGITVCERWRLFEHFYADMGPRPSASHSIDRIDGSKGYCPENCRWATPVEQARNRDVVRTIMVDGQSLCLPEAASKAGVNPKTLHSRLNYGWSLAEALTQPAKKTRRFTLLEFNGQSLCLKEWADRTGIGFRTLHSRIKRGWSIERALTEPVKVKT